MAAIMLCCLMACGPHKARYTETEMRDERIYKGGEPFTGQVWSEDGKSFCLTVRNGEVTAFAMYHANGKTAIQFDGVDEDIQAYDESGTEMPLDSFAIEYEYLAGTLKEIYGNDSVLKSEQP